MRRTLDTRLFTLMITRRVIFFATAEEVQLVNYRNYLYLGIVRTIVYDNSNVNDMEHEGGLRFRFLLHTSVQV